MAAAEGKQSRAAKRERGTPIKEKKKLATLAGKSNEGKNLKKRPFLKQHALGS